MEKTDSAQAKTAPAPVSKAVEIADWANIKYQPFQPASTPANTLSEARLAPDIWRRIRMDFRLLGHEHPRIHYEIRRLQNNPRALRLLLSRAKPYLHYITEQVEHNDLPRELALLPAVESGFRPFAYSQHGAAGLWQFMPATGRMLGLQQHWWYDGRRDVTASTKAALRYLTSLNKRFDGNWLYALAAYNAGAGTVNRALRKARENGQSQDYWSLQLPAETRAYIPRLIALAKIIDNPEYYGVRLPQIDNAPYFVAAKNHQQIDLRIAAELAGMPLQDLLNINPAFKQGVTHPQSSAQLLLPVDKRIAFNQALDRLPASKRLRWHRHKIRSGETLLKIAHQYNVSASAIRQANNLSGSRIRAGGKLLIPMRQTALLAQAERKNAKEKVRYHVRKGDSLYEIARKFQVKIADLRRWNNVNSYLRPGQQLTLYVNPT